jgi:hypothetical protein
MVDQDALLITVNIIITLTLVTTLPSQVSQHLLNNTHLCVHDDLD